MLGLSAPEMTVLVGGLRVLGGNVGGSSHGVLTTVPFRPGRTDATQEQTDVQSVGYLEPRADGFRNYLRPGEKTPAEKLLVEKAYMLGLSAPEMTVLVGGLRVLGGNVGGSSHGVLT
ncbi:catalase-peroxidase, partial [Methylobacterium radiotolerans]